MRGPRILPVALAALAAAIASCVSSPPTPGAYTEADFAAAQKFDAHVHANVESPEFLDVARRDGFELLSINVDYPDFPPLAEQARVAHALQATDPRVFRFATTFGLGGFGTTGWAEVTIRQIDEELARGALAVKVWKNVGMVERDAAGRLLALDDSLFDPVMRHIEDLEIPLVVHQAEPRNCWLPLERMTTENDRSYFREHPEYYMFLHPEMPSHEALMATRDRFVERHPRLSVVGAHLASLEWDVDAVARFLDEHPNATVDLAARMSELQNQSRTEPDRVRHFFLRYQDRILYGSDLTQDPPTAAERAQNPPIGSANFAAEADAFWRSDWTYLATTSTQFIGALGVDVAGLGLPRTVIDKVYYANAQRVFHLERAQPARPGPTVGAEPRRRS